LSWRATTTFLESRYFRINFSYSRRIGESLPSPVLDA